MNYFLRLICLIAVLSSTALAGAQEAEKSMADRIDNAVAPIAKFADKIVFFGFEVKDGVVLPVVLVILAFTAIFLTK